MNWGKLGVNKIGQDVYKEEEVELRESWQVWSKRKKYGTGEAMAHFIIVTVAQGKGVVLCEQYVEQFTGIYFADFIWERFHEAFVNSANPNGKLFL